MSPTRPTRDHESAPGDAPGAESFPRSGGSDAPQGIVRLSDLFSVDDFPDAAQSAARRLPHSKRRSSTSGALSSPATASGSSKPRRTAATCQPGESEPSVDGTPTLAPGAARDIHSPAESAPLEADAGPAYESLFGNESDTRRRPKRERKPATALQRALGLLTRREHSRKELVRKLVQRGVDAGEVEAAVDKLAGAGWQDDARFAESLVRSRASTGYGPLHIRAELGTHDLPAEVRQAALDDFDGDWVEIARDLIARRYARVEDARQRERKASDFLIRRGFPGDVVRAAVRSAADD